MSASDQLPALTDGSIEWRDATSKNGMSFRIGVKKDEGATEKSDSSVADEAEPAVATWSKKPFGINVNWPVGGRWFKPTTDEVKNTAAITRYCLTQNDDPIYKYILHFTNTEHYDYYFHDESGDLYRCNTWKNKDHYVEFNSSRPTIGHIAGS